MLNRRKRLAVFTAVAGLLSVPAMDALAQSVLPFGKANPIQSLSEQIDRLEKRVGELEHPLIPKSLSGVYSVTTTGVCLEVWGKDITWGGIDFEQWKAAGAIVNNWQPAGVARVRSFTTISTETYTPTAIAGEGTVSQSGDSKSIIVMDEKTALVPQQQPIFVVSSEHCNSTYKMSPLNDGTFTKTQTGCIERRWTEQFTLQGRVLDGGKTLTLVSTTADWEPEIDRPASGRERVCTRTQTARRISD